MVLSACTSTPSSVRWGGCASSAACALPSADRRKASAISAALMKRYVSAPPAQYCCMTHNFNHYLHVYSSCTMNSTVMVCFSHVMSATCAVLDASMA